MKVTPNEGQVLIRKDDVVMSKGGIALPADVSKSPLMRGVVHAVGEPMTLQNGQKMNRFVKPGDVVLFAKDSSVKLPIDEKDMYMCVEATIICKLEEEVA